jgi:NADPH:quinone reductase-like Zn-dependent oxidoreductase
MKAIVLTAFGGVENLQLQEVPVPAVDAGELLVRVFATSINPLDYQIRRGDYPQYVPLPAIIGHDVSGVVEKVGAGVNGFKPGDEVSYTPKIFGPKGGSYAEFDVVPQDLVAIDYATDDYVEQVSKLTGGRGVNVVLDTIGGKTLERSPTVLVDAGRVVSLVDIATPQNLADAWGVNAEYHFVFTRQNRGKLLALKELLERERIRPVVGATFRLSEIGAAHSALEQGRHGDQPLRGKVVIEVSCK